MLRFIALRVIEYLTIGMATAFFYAVVIGDPGQMVFLLMLLWPMFWAMAFIFAAAAIGS